jgi:hypothetical protein
MGDRIAERMLFEVFLETNPDFAGESIRDWTQPGQDPPDILCITVSGRRIGVELGEWLNQGQMTEAKGREMIQNSILAAIGNQPDNNLENIYYAWMHPRQRARVKPEDMDKFRSEILRLTSHIDRRWEQEPDWCSPQGLLYRDFSPFPTVGKYLDGLTFFPRLQYVGWPPNGQIKKRQWPAGCDWLVFRCNGGAYSERSSVAALRDIIARKIAKYTSKPPQIQMDGFCLLIHYNQALLYNTPLETLAFKYDDAARVASEFIGDDPGAFQKVFLLLAIEPGQKVFQLYPA